MLQYVKPLTAVAYLLHCSSERSRTKKKSQWLQEWMLEHVQLLYACLSILWKAQKKSIPNSLWRKSKPE